MANYKVLCSNSSSSSSSVCLFTFYTLPDTRVLNSFEELCIMRAAAENSFTRVLNPRKFNNACVQLKYIFNFENIFKVERIYILISSVRFLCLMTYKLLWVISCPCRRTAMILLYSGLFHTLVEEQQLYYFTHSYVGIYIESWIQKLIFSMFIHTHTHTHTHANIDRRTNISTRTHRYAHMRVFSRTEILINYIFKHTHRHTHPYIYIYI